MKLERIENIETKRRTMQTTPKILRPAQNEVHRTAHDQDLVEVPKRAVLDRAAEGKRYALPEVEPAKQDK
jgi:hypothetical protein